VPKHVHVEDVVKITIKLRLTKAHFVGLFYTKGGTRWRSWLRHCATSRKVAGSIPDGVVRFFH